MKKYSTALLIFMLSIAMNPLFAQNDSLIWEMENFLVLKNLKTKSFLIQDKNHKTIAQNLKFARISGNSVQVIDQYNKSYFFDRNLKKQDTLPKEILRYCGTVPHYSLWIESKEKAFVVMKDETFYDAGNKIPAEEMMRISKETADKIYFLNGEITFSYTSNYAIGSDISVSPETIIIEKAGKFSVVNDEKKTIFDDLKIEEDVIRVFQNGLQGFYGTTELKYKSLGDFYYNLARFELPNGKKGFVDVNGNEYFD